MPNSAHGLSEPDAWSLLQQSGLSPGDLPHGVSGDDMYAEVLYLLTRMRFEGAEARRFWGEIVQHRTGLHQVLGRDVGIRVAVADYFTNLHPKLRDPVIVEVQVLLQKERGALMDDLTGLYNRRYFNDAIHREVERFKRFGQHFSLLMVDVDHFKQFNDTHGHLAGDEALRMVAGVLREAGRTFDHVVRYGGEEFALILPHTDSEQALAAAERLRLAVAEAAAPVSGGFVRLTVSLGVATFPLDALSARELLKRADEALYEAKGTRNQVCAYAEKNRRHPRTDLRLSALCNSGGCTTPDLESLNVSFGGMLCLSPAPLLPGTQVEIALGVPGQWAEAMHVRGRVVRLERKNIDGMYEIALSFDPDSRAEERTLVRLVELHQGLEG